MSSWKDTVMDNEDFTQLAKDYPNERGIQEVIPVILQAQAEISFKAGYNQSVLDNDNWARDTYGYELGKIAGIREVVEWVELHEKSTCMDCLCAFDFRNDEWQDQKEKWGINETHNNKAHKC